MGLFSSTPELEYLLDYDNIPIPAGKRVKSTAVVDTAGIETVRIILEDIPVEPPKFISYAEVLRK